MIEKTKKELTLKEIEERKKKILDLKRKEKPTAALNLISVLIKVLMFHTSASAKIAIGWAMHQAGAVYEKTEEDWKEARDWYQAAFAYRVVINDFVGQAYTIFQMAMFEQAYKFEKEDVLPYFQRAKPYVLRAIEILRGKVFLRGATDEDKTSLGDMYQNLAYIHQQEGDINRAMITYLMTLDCRVEFNDKRGEAVTLARMVEIEEDLQKATDYLNKAEKVFEEIGDISRLKQIRETREEIQKRKDKK